MVDLRLVNFKKKKTIHLMGIKNRLTIMSFLQFFCLGSLVDYHCKLLVWHEIGTELSLDWFWNDGVHSLFMPTLTLLLIDGLMLKKLYGYLHILYAGVLFYIRK
jgi:NHS family xanthosine MFS transporter